MIYFRFVIDGQHRSFPEFYPDEQAAERAAFEASLELSRTYGRLVFVSVEDENGNQLCRVPRIPDGAWSDVPRAPSNKRKHRPENCTVNRGLGRVS